MKLFGGKQKRFIRKQKSGNIQVYKLYQMITSS